MWIGPKLLTFLLDPRDVELILSSHVYIDKASEYRFFKPWLGDGLLISTGKRINLSSLLFSYIHIFHIILTKKIQLAMFLSEIKSLTQKIKITLLRIYNYFRRKMETT